MTTPVRLSLTEFVGHGEAALPGVQFGDVYARNYIKDFGSTYPAVWALAQRTKPGTGLEDSNAMTGVLRQNFIAEVVLRVVVQRMAPGQVNAGADLNALVASVIDAFVGWTPTGALAPLILVTTQDGPANESVAFCDVVLSTIVTYTKTLP